MGEELQIFQVCSSMNDFDQVLQMWVSIEIQNRWIIFDVHSSTFTLRHPQIEHAENTSSPPRQRQPRPKPCHPSSRSELGNIQQSAGLDRLPVLVAHMGFLPHPRPSSTRLGRSP